MNKSEQLIACLEGEIAKRDEELAACRVAVENCELFRARIVGLECELSDIDFARRVSLQNEGDLAETLNLLRAELARVTRADAHYQAEALRLAAELAAIKAQEPVEYQLRALIRDVTNIPEAGYYMPQSWHDQVIALSLSGKLDAPVSEAKRSAAELFSDVLMCQRNQVETLAGDPYMVGLHNGMSMMIANFDNSPDFERLSVSEAKAQGVVMPTVDQAMRVVLREMGSSKHIRGTSNWCADVGRAVLDEVARLNAAPVQQVSVPDVSSMARILADRNADACNVNREDNWAIYGQDYIDDVKAMLAAAPAAGSHKEQK